MKRIRILALAILAIFALSAIVATAAQAKPGPYFKIKGKRLEGKEKFTAKAQTATFTLTAVGVTITCKKLKVEAGAELNGLAGNNSSTSKQTVVFEECSLAGNGKNCKLAAADKGIIKTAPVIGTLDYPKEVPAEGDILLVLFTPETGSVFTTIKTEPGAVEGCTVEGNLAVEGSTLAVAENGKFEPFKLKVNVPETVNLLLRFPSNGTLSCTESNGVVTCKKHKLTLAGKTSNLEGHVELTLASGSIWGVFSG